MRSMYRNTGHIQNYFVEQQKVSVHYLTNVKYFIFKCEVLIYLLFNILVKSLITCVYIGKSVPDFYFY